MHDKLLHTTNKITHVMKRIIVEFIIFLVCTSYGHFMDTDLGCVCAVDYFQTATDPLECTACPPGSTTNGETNSDACCKYDNIP